MLKNQRLGGLVAAVMDQRPLHKMPVGFCSEPRVRGENGLGVAHRVLACRLALFPGVCGLNDSNLRWTMLNKRV